MENIIGIGVPINTVPTHGNKPDLRKVGKDIYEVLTGTGSQGYKQLARKQTVKSESERKRGRNGAKPELRCRIAAHAKDEGRDRFWHADSPIQAGQEEAWNQWEGSVDVPQKQDEGLGSTLP